MVRVDETAVRPRPARRTGRFRSSIVLGITGTVASGAIVIGTVAPPHQASAAPRPPAVEDALQAPSSMAALGDSITRGFDACGFWQDCPLRSWSTGTDYAVASQYQRLASINSGISGNAYNNAKSGARMSDLNRQAQLTVSQGADYVTILMGANDACRTTLAEMTPVDTFEAQFRTAMTTLRRGLPGVAVFVASIPDVKHLWDVGKDLPAARSAWKLGRLCPSMLANPVSVAPADIERRNLVQRQIIAYNDALARVCAQDSLCRYDGGAVFRYRFHVNQVSRWDYFHPNAIGQRTLAEVTFRHGFGWQRAPEPDAYPRDVRSATAPVIGRDVRVFTHRRSGIPSAVTRQPRVRYSAGYRKA
jgi:lysophospholipase L1-like esterase